MSPILNALKRAEHERQRGQLPDPLAPTGPEARRAESPCHRAPHPGWASALGAGALAMGWFLGRGRGMAGQPLGARPQASNLAAGLGPACP